MKDQFIFKHMASRLAYRFDPDCKDTKFKEAFNKMISNNDSRHPIKEIQRVEAYISEKYHNESLEMSRFKKSLFYTDNGASVPMDDMFGNRCTMITKYKKLLEARDKMTPVWVRRYEKYVRSLCELADHE